MHHIGPEAIGRDPKSRVTRDLEWEWLTDAGVKGRSPEVDVAYPVAYRPSLNNRFFFTAGHSWGRME